MNAVFRRCQLKDIKLPFTWSILTASFHTSAPVGEKKKYPFEYVRPPRVPWIFRSGDKEGLKKIDMTQPREEFRGSKELETADDVVKKIFSLEFAPKRCTTRLLKTEYVTSVQKHKVDFYSLEAIVAKLTVSIRRGQAQVKLTPKNGAARNFIKLAIDKRNKMLRTIRKVDSARFDWLLEKLRIAYIPPPRYHYRVTYAFGVRELTQKYCEQIRTSRLQAYKDKLKAEQADFIKEKAEKLKFIAEEEKALGLGEGQVEELKSELMKPKPYPVASTLLQIARKVDNTEDTAMPSMPPQHPRIDY